MNAPSRRTIAALLLTACAACTPGAFTKSDFPRWKREAAAVTITRDDWGIAHVHGRSDADAVFGMEYAQAEDDFNRVEMNYLNALGRTAEALGPTALVRDLRIRLVENDDTLKALYAASPAWLRRLMQAATDGLNYYLFTHRNVKPKVLSTFEPWMVLAFTEGSIGWDIERVDLQGLRDFYASAPSSRGPTSRIGRGGDGVAYAEPSGSNGIAIAPQNTRDHHALLYINPHTSFYFRSELQVSSDSGLDAYGAVTWGQFFVYQGFNATAGWMHTSSGVDNVDQFLETVVPRNGGYLYRHGDSLLPVLQRPVTLQVLTPKGMSRTSRTVYATRHGPVVGRQGDKWVTVSLMVDPVHALEQAWTRMKAKDYAEFRKTLELHTNSSNNTVFADAEGNIAYFHSNYIPRRDPRFDWTKAVDGSDPRTDYRGLLSVDETPHLLNPASGWLYNSNNWPWSAAGPSSPRRAGFPAYVETGTEESPRGRHALAILPGRHDFTMASLTAAAFDSWLPSFARMVPPLLRAWDRARPSDPLKAALKDQISTLRAWDFRWDTSSVATALAVFWGTAVEQRVSREARAAGLSPETFVVERAAPGVLLQSLADATDSLKTDFGTWRTPWGAINRFQRLDDSIEAHFDDAKPSIAVGFTSSRWGSLASFGARPYRNTLKWYGSSGNSFVAVVEFGDGVRAMAVTAGGESGDPASKHFQDQARRYATGDFRPVYFYPAQLQGHIERVYHPGE